MHPLAYTILYKTIPFLMEQSDDKNPSSQAQVPFKHFPLPLHSFGHALSPISCGGWSSPDRKDRKRNGNKSLKFIIETTILLTQDVVLTSFQRHLIVIDVRWTLKHCVLRDEFISCSHDNVRLWMKCQYRKLSWLFNTWLIFFPVFVYFTKRDFFTNLFQWIYRWSSSYLKVIKNLYKDDKKSPLKVCVSSLKGFSSFDCLSLIILIALLIFLTG